VSGIVDELGTFKAGAPPARVFAARQLSRSEFFAGLYIIGCANGLGGNVIRALTAGDWTGGVGQISAIVWFACLAGISLVLSDKHSGEQYNKVRATDIAIAPLFLVIVAAPASELNWIAVTGLSFYLLLFTKPSATRRRGALIMLALTVPMLWSRILFSFFSKIFLEIDSMFVGWLLGTTRSGNVIDFADGSGQMVVLPACSSLANVSLAFLCWVAVSQWLGHRQAAQDWLWCVLACASVVALNVSRIAIMGLSQWHYETFHYGWGATLTNAVILATIVTLTMLGVRRELFARV
jgi:hypothetical protein